MRLFSSLVLLFLFAGCESDSINSVGQFVSINDLQSQYVPTRNIKVYLPPNFNADSAYHVIYMHDGQNLFDTKNAYSGYEWRIDETLDSLINNKIVAPAVVVGINNTKYRWNEYLPEFCIKTTLDSSRLMPYARQSIWDTSVYSLEYLRFVTTELRPYIEKNYVNQVKNNYIMGSSMGGLIAAYAVATYPDVYSGAACLSTHWPALDGACVERIYNDLPMSGRHKYYFDRGTIGLDSLYQPYQNMLDSLVTLKQGYIQTEYKSEVFEGADHNEKSWQKRVHIPLIFLLKDELSGK